MRRLLADRPVSGRKRAAQMRRDANWRILYALYQVGIPANSDLYIDTGRGQTSCLLPLAPRVPALEV